MLDDAFQRETDAALTDLAVRPPATKPSVPSRFSLWKTLTAPSRGLGVAAGEVASSTADVLKAFGDAASYGLQGQPGAVVAFGQDELRSAGEKAKERIDSPDYMVSEYGKWQRGMVDPLRPDPLTAHAAEAMLFEFSRAAGKVVGSSLTLGPLGVPLAGIEEGITQSEALRQKGVDLPARAAVGAVQGAGLAIGAALPVAGQTVAQTAGLVVAGGPAMFMSQQAASRAILDAAGYGELSQQYDPFDPVGLTLSTLLPAGFGAWHMAAKGRPSQPPAAVPAPKKTVLASSIAEIGRPSPEIVDAARVLMAVEAQRGASLAAPFDIRSAGRDDTAAVTAARQMAEGDPVRVTDLAPVETDHAQQALHGFWSRIEESMRHAQETLTPAERAALRIDVQDTGVRSVDGGAQRPAEPGTTRAADEDAARANEMSQLLSEAQRAMEGGKRAPEAIGRLKAAGVEVSPELNNAIIALDQQYYGPNGLTDWVRTAARNEAGAKTQDLIASAVDKGQQLPPAIETPATPKLRELEITSPKALDAEIPVAWDSSGQVSQRVNARELLDQVRREAQMEIDEAPLMEIAAQCFLQGGG